MKKPYIIIIILFGCFLSVFQIVQAQKNSGRASFFKRLQSQVGNYLSPKGNQEEGDSETTSASALTIADSSESHSNTNELSELDPQIDESDSQLTGLNEAISEQLELTNKLGGSLNLGQSESQDQVKVSDSNNSGILAEAGQPETNGVYWSEVAPKAESDKISIDIPELSELTESSDQEIVESAEEESFLDPMDFLNDDVITVSAKEMPAVTEDTFVEISNNEITPRIYSLISNDEIVNESTTFQSAEAVDVTQNENHSDIETELETELETEEETELETEADVIVKQEAPIKHQPDDSERLGFFYDNDLNEVESESHVIADEPDSVAIEPKEQDPGRTLTEESSNSNPNSNSDALAISDFEEKITDTEIENQNDHAEVERSHVNTSKNEDVLISPDQDAKVVGDLPESFKTSEIVNDVETEIADNDTVSHSSPTSFEEKFPQEFDNDDFSEIDTEELVDLDNPEQYASSSIENIVGESETAEFSPEVEYFIQQYKEELEAEQKTELANIPDQQNNSIELKPATYETIDTNPNTAPSFTKSLATELGASTEVAPFISIDEGPLVSAIRQLARQAQINFIFDPRIVSGLNQGGEAVEYPNVTIRFENVTAMQALEAVLDSYDLAIVQNKKTKIAKVTFKAAPQEEVLESQVIQIKYHSAEEMVALLSTFIGSRSSIRPHPKSGKIVVSATQGELERIAELIYELDVPSRNVLIEANILETSRNPKSLRGVDWSGTFSNHKVSFGNGNSGGTQSAAGNNIITDFDGSGMSLISGGAFSPSVAFLNSDGLSAVLNFLNSDTETQVVATPRTVTQNEVEATLQVTRAYPIFQESPGSQAVPATTAIIYTNLGTILKVLPRISADDSVTLEVKPEVSSVDGKDQQQIGGKTSEANIYAIRRMETTVRVPSGHTLVMGGLTSDRRTKKRNKVPVLGDIPVLGNLFQNREKNQEKQNLIVFITPTIVREGDYQPATTDFLESKIELDEDEESFLSAWDQAEPYEW